MNDEVKLQVERAFIFNKTGLFIAKILKVVSLQNPARYDFLTFQDKFDLI